MRYVLPALGVMFMAFCIWLGVRIFNRRERWAKRTAWGVVALLLLFPLSVGPASRFAAYTFDPGKELPAPREWMYIYWPIGWAAIDRTPLNNRSKQSQVSQMIAWYLKLWIPRGTHVLIPASRDGTSFRGFTK